MGLILQKKAMEIKYVLQLKLDTTLQASLTIEKDTKIMKVTEERKL